jgi:2-polyprenyl-6-methoxyphenol hydroxylase-like FAD-dependent oxidoreductase
MPSHDVLVRGTGAVGLVAALALARQGLSVALVGAPAQQRADDVRAYALNAASVTLLESLKVWDALPADARCAVHDMRVQGDSGGAVLNFSAWQQGLAELAWIVDAAELERALNAAAGFAPHLQRVDRVVPAALQVLAEGKDSASRAELGVVMDVQDYGQHAVAARLVSDQAHGGLASQWFASPDVLALLPQHRPERERGFGLVWSLPSQRAQELLALPETAFEQALMLATEGAAGTLKLAGPRASWPLTRARASAVHGSGWVLVGDAAHVVHPLAGQGLNLGLADVAVLVEEVAAREAWRDLGDTKLLARYARRRAAPTWAMGLVTDSLWQLFAHPAPLAKELRNRGLSLVDHLAPLKRALTQQATRQLF